MGKGKRISWTYNVRMCMWCVVCCVVCVDESEQIKQQEKVRGIEEEEIKSQSFRKKVG